MLKGMKSMMMGSKRVLNDEDIKSINPNYEKFKEIQSEKSIEQQNSVLSQENSGLGDLGDYMKQDFEFTDTTQDQKGYRLKKYRRVAAFPEIADIVDEYVDSMIVMDVQNKYAYLKFYDANEPVSDDEKGDKKKRLEEEFDHYTSLFSFQTNEEYLRTFIVDGELAFENIIGNDSDNEDSEENKQNDSKDKNGNQLNEAGKKNKKNQKEKDDNGENTDSSDGIQAVSVIPNETYDYIYDNSGNIVGILVNAQKISSETDSAVTLDHVDARFKEGGNRDTMSGFRDVDNTVKYERQDGNQPIIPLPISQVTHFTSGMTNNTGTVNYSILERAKRPFNQLRLTEDAIIIYRVVRAPLRYLFNIYTGSMPHHKARRVIENLKSKYGKKKYYDPVSGSISSDFDVHSITESFWFAKGSNDKGSQVSTIGGNESMWNDFPDLKYFLRKLYRVMKVPFNRVIGDDTSPGEKERAGTKEDVTYEDYRFAKQIIGFQRRLAKGMYDGFKTHLKLIGLWDQYKLDDSTFYINFVPPILYDMYFKQKMMQIKFENYENLADRDEISASLMQGDILDWDESKINKNKKMLRDDRIWEAQTEKAADAAEETFMPHPQRPDSGGGGGSRF